MNTSQIEFKRVNNDVNGNPRYVCHFHALLTERDKESCKEVDSNTSHRLGVDYITKCYNLALRKAKKIGGKKFHNKQYGGGVVFQSYNIAATEKSILDIVAKG